MDSDSSYKFAKSTIGNLNKLITETNRLRKQNEINEKLSKQTKILKDLHFVAASMRAAGATEKSIHLALRGMYEYLKVTYEVKLENSNEKIIKNPDSMLEHSKQASGIVLSSVETQQVDWLWQKRVPLGKITILDGDPGMGKSLLAIHVAACVSTGQPMPDGAPGKKGTVILIAPEDTAEDTIKPRVEAAGGDPSQMLLLNTVEHLDILDTKKINVNERLFSLAQDQLILENAIKQTKAILVVLDPLMAVLGRSIDSSRDQDIREVLNPLGDIAERTGCAILIIRHLNKGSSDNILYRGAGSIGIIAVARMGLLVAHDPDDEQKRVFATIKNNLSKIAPNLSYQIAENEKGAPYIQWLGENHHITSTLLRPGSNQSYERQQILRVLKEADSPLDAKEIAKRTGQNYEASRSTLNRMYESKEIARPYRGKYTTLNHPSIAKKSADTNETSATSITNATSATNPASDLGSLEE